MDMTFIRLKELDGEIFTVTGVVGFKFALWDAAAKQMLVADRPTKGYKKRWILDTDRGRLEVSQVQMGKILEAVFNGGKAEPIDKPLSVKSNGQEVPDYYFNRVMAGQQPAHGPDDVLGEAY